MCTINKFTIFHIFTDTEFIRISLILQSLEIIKEIFILNLCLSKIITIYFHYDSQIFMNHSIQRRNWLTRWLTQFRSIISFNSKTNEIPTNENISIYSIRRSDLFKFIVDDRIHRYFHPKVFKQPIFPQS